MVIKYYRHTKKSLSLSLPLPPPPPPPKENFSGTPSKINLMQLQFKSTVFLPHPTSQISLSLSSPTPRRTFHELRSLWPQAKSLSCICNTTTYIAPGQAYTLPKYRDTHWAKPNYWRQYKKMHHTRLTGSSSLPFRYVCSITGCSWAVRNKEYVLLQVIDMCSKELCNTGIQNKRWHHAWPRRGADMLHFLNALS